MGGVGDQTMPEVKEKRRCSATTQEGRRCRRDAAPGCEVCALHRSRAAYEKAAQDKFLAAYAQCGRVQKAKKIASIDNNYHTRWLKEDPGYVMAFEEATKQFVANEVKFRARVAFAAKRQLYRRIITGRATPAEVIFACKVCPHDGWKEYGSLEEGREVVGGLIEALRAMDKGKPANGSILPTR